MVKARVEAIAGVHGVVGELLAHVHVHIGGIDGVEER